MRKSLLFEGPKDRGMISLYLTHRERRVLAKFNTSTPKTLAHDLRKLNLKHKYHQIIKEKLSAQCAVWKEMRLIEKCREFPFVEIWRYAIDSYQAIFGAWGFENELGYIKGYMNGIMKFALQTRHQPKNRQWYVQLHDITINNVLNNDGEPILKGLKRGSYYGLSENVDKDPLGM